MGDGVITTREMRVLEANAEYFGISRLQLMENAGRSLASEIAARFLSKKTRIVVFCGLGGNGGDGFVLARHLLALGYRVEVIIAGRADGIEHEAARKNYAALQNLRRHINISEVRDSSEIPEVKADVVVDAILGVGLKGVPRQPILQLVRTINEMQAFRLAVDAPTGLDSDSGEVRGESIKANLTVTFHKAKPGLLKADDYVGELKVQEIGLPIVLETWTGPGDVMDVAKPRSAESHKGDFGKLLIVGGSEIYSGAPVLVALAALRAGTDLAYIAAPEKTGYAISSMTANVITIKLKGSYLKVDDVSQISQHLAKATGLVVGPGLGLRPETLESCVKIVAAAEEMAKPIVLDADGLKAFAETKRPLRAPSVLTPHAGEFQILTGKQPPSSLEERISAVKKTAARLNAVVLLKGRTDIISDGDRVKLNSSGNPGMTVGGTGDVLSGIVGALLSQQVNPFEAAAAGAFINGAAGDFVKREKGYHMMPTDLLDWIPKVMDDPMAHSQVRMNES